MDFIIFFVKLIFTGLTSLQTLLFFVLPSITVILLFRFFMPKKSYEIVDGEIESYRNAIDFKKYILSSESTNIGIFKKLTFRLVNGERIFFKRATFRRYLWGRVRGGMKGTNSHVGMFGKFCCVKTQYNLSIFAFGNENNQFVFLDDIDKIHSYTRIIFNICVRLALIFFIPYLGFHRTQEAKDLWVISTLSMPFIIIAGYSMYHYIVSFPQMKQAFETEIKLLEQAGIPKPLG